MVISETRIPRNKNILTRILGSNLNVLDTTRRVLINQTTRKFLNNMILHANSYLLCLVNPKVMSSTPRVKGLKKRSLSIELT